MRSEMIQDRQVEHFDLSAEEVAAGGEFFAEELSNVRSLWNCAFSASSAASSGCACVSTVGTYSSLSG